MCKRLKQTNVFPWFWGRLGPYWGRLGASWGRLGGVLGRLGAPWGRLGGVFRASWGVLGRLGASWRILGSSWGRLSGVLERLGASWGRLGGSLDVSWGVLNHVRHVQEASQSRLGLQNQPKRPKATLNGSLRCSFVVPTELLCRFEFSLIVVHYRVLVGFLESHRGSPPVLPGRAGSPCRCPLLVQKPILF